MSKTRVVAAISMLSAVVIVPYYLFPLISDRVSPINEGPRSCEGTDVGVQFCEQRYLDDGYIRFSSRSSEMQNCCALERQSLDAHAISYTVLACDVSDSSKIDCSKVQNYGISNWIVDNRELTSDTDRSGTIDPNAADISGDDS